MKIIINGAAGRMGTVLCAVIRAGYCGAELAGMAGPPARENGALPVLDDLRAEADCIIDFSNHAGTFRLLACALSRRLPVVIATTGQTKEEFAAIREASKQIPIFCAENLSLGISLLAGLVRTAVAMLPDADVEIVERHHNGKLDVPSGTALMLAQAVRDARPNAHPVVGRHENGMRGKQEIGIHSLRAGNAIGTHEVVISTDTECISLKHEVQERSLYAKGALEAAAFLIRQPPGLYRMEDLLRERSI